MAVVKKRTSRDQRVEPLPSGTPVDSVTNYRVDRVFPPAPRARTPGGSAPPPDLPTSAPSAPEPPDAASEAANALLARRRTHKTLPPPPGIVVPARPTTEVPAIQPGSAEVEVELSLRRQLSRLQRQHAEAQRELANKDDELALEVEKRMLDQAAYETLAAEQRKLLIQLEELRAFEARTQGIEQRLQDSVATCDELAQRAEREHGAAAAAQARVDELMAAFDETRSLWNAERAMLEERAAAERTQLEDQRTAAVEEATSANDRSTTSLRAAHETELAKLRESHERSMAAVRGELEPKDLELANLAEKTQGLADELDRAKAEAARDATERDETHARELKQNAERHLAQLAEHQRKSTAELTKVTNDRGVEIVGLQQQVRGLEAREQALGETVTTLRASELELKRHAADSREKVAQLEVNLGSLEARQQLAASATEALLDEQRSLRAQLEASQTESRRNALDRMRFVAYLEEGLAMIGALPPAFTMEADPPPDGAEPPPDPSMVLPEDDDADDDASDEVVSETPVDGDADADPA